MITRAELWLFVQGRTNSRSVAFAMRRALPRTRPLHFPRRCRPGTAAASLWQGPEDRNPDPFGPVPFPDSGCGRRDHRPDAATGSRTRLANYGLLVDGVSAGLVQYNITAREWSEPDQLPSPGRIPGPHTHPQHTHPHTSTPTLTPTATVTPTPTLTPTPTTTPTATPSFTPTATFTPTGHPTATHSPSPTFTPTFTPTVTPTSTPTATPTPTPIPTVATTALPAADTYLFAAAPDENFGGSNQLLLRSGGDSAVLLRYDLAGLPPGAVIVDAELFFYTIDRTNTRPLTARLYRLRRPWSETDATASLAGVSQPWQAPMAAGEDDRDPSLLAALVLAPFGWSSIDITAIANEWLADPATNFGLLLDGESDGSVQYSLTSRDWTIDPALRPWLRFSYQVLPPVTPTPTPTPPAPDRLWLPRLLRDLPASAATSWAPIPVRPEAGRVSWLQRFLRS
ncbi:MAG: DNRLRE domain-containing protein [Caldilineales bacterium]|nr:DNRLRE domain-containing protein [Caldilineales bacterium]